MFTNSYVEFNNLLCNITVFSSKAGFYAFYLDFTRNLNYNIHIRVLNEQVDICTRYKLREY